MSNSKHLFVKRIGKRRVFQLTLGRLTVLILLSALLLGCVPVQWVHPTNPAADVRKDLAACVASVNKANPGVNELQRQGLIINCMQAKGYYLSVAPTPKP